MQIQVRWENGALHPVRPLRLKHKTVIVEIADDEFEVKDNTYHIPADILQEVNHVQGRFEAIRNAPHPPGNTVPELTKKQMERTEAFAWRDEVRKERGHTA